jgi:hypothetical protein
MSGDCRWGPVHRLRARQERGNGQAQMIPGWGSWPWPTPQVTSSTVTTRYGLAAAAAWDWVHPRLAAAPSGIRETAGRPAGALRPASAAPGRPPGSGTTAPRPATT